MAQTLGAQALSLPIIVTEQYPKALGNTVAEISSVLPPGTTVVAKTRFSMLTPEVEDWLKQRGDVKQVRAEGGPP